MTTRGHIREKHAHLTIFDLSRRATLLRANTRRVLATFGEAGLVDDQNRRFAAQLFHDVRTKIIAHPITLPDSVREQALHAVGAGPPGMFSQLPAVFSGNFTQNPSRDAANARRCGSGRVKCGAIRACRRKRAWPQRQTSPGVVLLPMEVVWWSCFIFFSFLRLLWFSGSHPQSITCGRRSWGFFCFSSSSC
jgi:hypothetical protein